MIEKIIQKLGKVSQGIEKFINHSTKWYQKFNRRKKLETDLRECQNLLKRLLCNSTFAGYKNIENNLAIMLDSILMYKDLIGEEQYSRIKNDLHSFNKLDAQSLNSEYERAAKSCLDHICLMLKQLE